MGEADPFKAHKLGRAGYAGAEEDHRFFEPQVFDDGSVANGASGA